MFTGKDSNKQAKRVPFVKQLEAKRLKEQRDILKARVADHTEEELDQQVEQVMKDHIIQKGKYKGASLEELYLQDKAYVSFYLGQLYKEDKEEALFLNKMLGLNVKF